MASSKTYQTTTAVTWRHFLVLEKGNTSVLVTGGLASYTLHIKHLNINSRMKAFSWIGTIWKDEEGGWEYINYYVMCINWKSWNAFGQSALQEEPSFHMDNHNTFLTSPWTYLLSHLCLSQKSQQGGTVYDNDSSLSGQHLHNSGSKLLDLPHVEKF